MWESSASEKRLSASVSSPAVDAPVVREREGVLDRDSIEARGVEVERVRVGSSASEGMSHAEDKESRDGFGLS